VIFGGRRRGPGAQTLAPSPLYRVTALPLFIVTSSPCYLFIAFPLYPFTSFPRHLFTSLHLFLVNHLPRSSLPPHVRASLPSYIFTSLPRYFVTLSALYIPTFWHVYLITPLLTSLLRYLSRQLHIRRYTVLHRDLVTSWPLYIVTSPHTLPLFLATSFPRYLFPPLPHCLRTSFQGAAALLGYAVTLLPILPLYLDTLLHPYNLTFLTSLLVYSVTCLPRYLFAQLPRDRCCLFTPLPRHILTSLHRKFATSLPLYTATSLPRYLFLVSLLPRYLCTSLHL